jgi:hypothetical protein
MVMELFLRTNRGFQGWLACQPASDRAKEWLWMTVEIVDLLDSEGVLGSGNSFHIGPVLPT